MATAKEVLFFKAPLVETAYATQSARIDYFLQEAETGVAEEPAWARRTEAVALLAWHKWQMYERGKAGTAATGQVLERKLDNGSTKWADISKKFGDGPHGATEPGDEFDQLIATRWATPEVI